MGFIHKSVGAVLSRASSNNSYYFVKYIASSGLYIMFKQFKNNQQIVLFKDEYTDSKVIEITTDIKPLTDYFDNLYENNNRDTDGGALIDWVTFLENIGVDIE